MRGKVIPRLLAHSCCGITPAYAGKRMEKAKEMLRRKDHPRLCGEKSTDKRPFRKSSGSPPPMRGKVRIAVPAGAVLWITPAYAGKRAE